MAQPPPQPNIANMNAATAGMSAATADMSVATAGMSQSLQTYGAHQQAFTNELVLLPNLPVMRIERLLQEIKGSIELNSALISAQ